MMSAWDEMRRFRYVKASVSVEHTEGNKIHEHT